jgi:hypothetical protein
MTGYSTYSKMNTILSSYRYTFINRPLVILFCIFVLAAAFPGHTNAASSRGVHFEDEMTLAGKQLTLHGYWSAEMEIRGQSLPGRSL